jgi:hypothetical protein
MCMCPGCRAAVPEDHPCERVGGPEAPQPAVQVEDCGGGGRVGAQSARGGAAEAHHRHTARHARPSGGVQSFIESMLSCALLIFKLQYEISKSARFFFVLWEQTLCFDLVTLPLYPNSHARRDAAWRDVHVV